MELKVKKLRSRQRKCLERAKKYAEEQTTKHVLMKSQILAQQNVGSSLSTSASAFAVFPAGRSLLFSSRNPLSTLKVCATHVLVRCPGLVIRFSASSALSYMSRIYVGSISYDVSEEEIKEMFAEFGPIKGVSINYDASTLVGVLVVWTLLTYASKTRVISLAFQRHKGYAFVHYEYPEPAAIARDHMHGKFIKGKTLRVTPVGQSEDVHSMACMTESTGTHSGGPPESSHSGAEDHRRFWRQQREQVPGHLRRLNPSRHRRGGEMIPQACGPTYPHHHPFVSVQDLRSVFEAFGEITNCKLRSQATGNR
jgi:hypothetical protein